eukprot:TRINITY_DN23252_c0_g2_i1.p1 TRINITY_DN23252_c0_g2~~TRINITY_DN23252_c0_g2_i1.p1  ORF type:complete len:369 (-),score=44.69 TRINITY_DN23252_c0_g2_i1:71-1099(-)
MPSDARKGLPDYPPCKQPDVLVTELSHVSSLDGVPDVIEPTSLEPPSPDAGRGAEQLRDDSSGEDAQDDMSEFCEGSAIDMRAVTIMPTPAAIPGKVWANKFQRYSIDPIPSSKDSRLPSLETETNTTVCDHVLDAKYTCDSASVSMGDTTSTYVSDETIAAHTPNSIHGVISAQVDAGMTFGPNCWRTQRKQPFTAAISSDFTSLGLFHPDEGMRLSKYKVAQASTARSQEVAAEPLRYVKIPDGSVDTFRNFARNVAHAAQAETVTNNPFIVALRRKRAELESPIDTWGQRLQVDRQDGHKPQFLYASQEAQTLEQRLSTEREGVSLLEVEASFHGTCSM